MKKVIKRNQVIITSLAILIAVAGYLNFADVDLGFRDKEASADSSSILDQVDYDISDESALVEENSQNSLSDTADDTDTTTPNSRHVHDNVGRGCAYRRLMLCGTGEAFP